VKSVLKYNLVMRCKAMAVLSVYLFVTLSFIFFLSCGIVNFNDHQSEGKHKIENVHTHSVVQREDKATLKSGDNIISHNLSAIILYLHFTTEAATHSLSPFYLTYSRILNNYRFSYLTLLSLRI